MLTSQDITPRLFTPPQRLGWTHREPAAVPVPQPGTPSPARPPGPDPRPAVRAAGRRARVLGRFALLSAGLWALVVAGVVVPGLGVVRRALLPETERSAADLVLDAIPVLSLLALGPVTLVTVVLALVWSSAHLSLIGHRRRLGRWEATGARLRAEHEARQAAADDAGRRRRTEIDASPRWIPTDTAEVVRVDVVGGVPAGWAALLTTWGASVLGAGCSVLLLDLTSDAVGSQLAGAAADRGVPVHRFPLPDRLDASGLLTATSARDLAEVVASSAHALRSGAGEAHVQLLDAHLLRAVGERLAAPVTLERLRAGLAVVQRTGVSPAASLTPVEVDRLVELVDQLGSDGRTEDELQLLRVALDVLVPTGPPSAAPPDPSVDPGSGAAGVWDRDGLTLLWAADAGWQRQRLVQRLAARALVHQLEATTADPPAGRALVVAGADGLDRETLEGLLARCRQRGVRCLVLMHRLRQESEQLVGEDGAAVAFMRLGNGREAAAAADFIGRGHRFRLTTVSVQQGDTVTRSENESRGSSGSNVRLGWFGHQRSYTTSRGTGSSHAEATTAGEVYTRVYDLTVEPTALQALAPTAFVLVGSHDGRRTVTSGTCDPLLVAADRVALAPGARQAPPPRGGTARAPDGTGGTP